MRFLILTCNTGGGHNSSAAAIAEHLEAQGQTCVIQDYLDFLPFPKAKLIRDGHVLLYRKAPKLFGMGYRFEEGRMPKLLVSQCETCVDEFLEAVKEAQCDAVINVHMFPALTMTKARRQFGLKLPGYYVITDYTCYPGVSCTDLDAYFIPHPLLTEEFVSSGVPRDRLVASGIPVRAAFSQNMPRAQARAALSLPETGNLVLLTCGSMGAGPMAELTELLDRQLPQGDSLAVICGTNERLQRELGRMNLSSRTVITGFTRQMDLYMDAANVILTKAGGLSSTEALMKRTPMVYIDAVPGCETRNLEFMVRHGYAATAQTTQGLTDLVCSLLRHPEHLEAMSARIARDFPRSTMEALYARLDRDLSLSAQPGSTKA